MEYRGIDIKIKESLFFKDEYIVEILGNKYIYHSPEETRVGIDKTIRDIENNYSRPYI